MAFQFGPKLTSPGPASPGANTPLDRAVDDLAKDLKLHPVTSPFLRKALSHLVGCVHPTVGTGGVLLFELMATVARAVLDNCIARYGQINPEDETVIYAGSPIRLLRYYRTKTPGSKFHPDASLEGARGSSPEEHDAYFKAKNEEFENHHLLKRRFLTDAEITTLAVMRAIPDRLLSGLSEDQVKEVGDEIAARLTAQGHPVNLLTHSEARSLLAEKQAAKTSADGA